MNPKISATLIAILIIAMFVTGFAVYPHLPALVASHWDLGGAANGFLPRLGAVMLLPLITLVLFGVWALLPRLDPINRGFNGFRHVYDFFWILFSAFLAYVYAVTLLADLGFSFSLIHALLPALAVLIIILGALLPLVRRNWFFGIRTPWSLSSDTVWAKTHRFASPLFILAGLFLVVSAFATTRALFLWLVVAPLALAILCSVIASYIFLARERGASRSS